MLGQHQRFPRDLHAGWAAQRVRRPAGFLDNCTAAMQGFGRRPLQLQCMDHAHLQLPSAQKSVPLYWPACTCNSQNKKSKFQRAGVGARLVARVDIVQRRGVVVGPEALAGLPVPPRARHQAQQQHARARQRLAVAPDDRSDPARYATGSLERTVSAALPVSPLPCEHVERVPRTSCAA